MASTPEGFVSRVFLDLLAEELAARGAAGVGAEAEIAGLPGAPGDGRLPVAAWVRLLDAVAARLRDPLLGLAVGARMDARRLGVVGYLALSSATVGEALATAERRLRLVYDVNPLHVHVEPAAARLRLIWGTAHGRPGALADELAISATVAVVASLTGGRLRPLAVAFVNAAPPDTAPYVRHFGCPVAFDRPETEIRYPLASLAEPLPQPDPVLHRLLAEQADTLLAGLPDEDAFLHRLRRAIAARLPEGAPGLGSVARRLNLSPRTLQRRLAERRLAFGAVVEDTRRRRAEELLATPLGLAEVAARLGYSEHSAFSRAYRRWTGRPPRRPRRD